MQSYERLLDQARKQGDAAADKVVTTALSQGPSRLYPMLSMPEATLMQQPRSPVKEFLLAERKKPEWFDAHRITKGQRLFEQYAMEMMTLLGAMALPYCYAGSPGNKALYLSDKMRNAPGKRLMDTASFVIHVLTPGSLDATAGHLHINKVRLIHAVSRYHLQRSGQWNAQWGTPINQEDMAGTNLAFSYIILLGLQQSGHTLTPKEKEDFIFIWRYIGYLLHIDEALLPNSFAEAAQLTHVIRKRNFRKTEEGIILTNELLTFYKSSLPSWQAELVGAQVRACLGGEVADYLGLERDPIRDGLASWLTNFQALKNLLTVKHSTYREMLSQHLVMRNKYK